MTENVKDNQAFANIMGEATAMHERKNHDYGNTFGDLFAEFNEKHGIQAAMIYLVGHLKEKINRIDTLMDADAMVTNEHVRDSLMDLIGYAGMGVAAYDKALHNK